MQALFANDKDDNSFISMVTGKTVWQELTGEIQWR